MIFKRPHVSHRLLITLTMAFFFTLLGRVPVSAQEQSSQTPDLPQMQKKLEQLEKELRELKSEMKAATTAASSMAKAPTEELEAVPGPGVEATIETRQAEEHGEEVKQSNSLNFYGFAMLDSDYNFGTINPNWFDTERPTQLPSFTGEFGPNGSMFWGVRQTRFGVKSSTQTALGELKTIFEFELFGTGVDAGQTTFRLRHAWGELGQFGAGQTWSPFMDIDVFPNSLEYWRPNGMVFFRNVQLRWTPIQGNSNVMIALERPGASADGGNYSDFIALQNIAPQFKWPDLSGHVRIARNWGYIQVGAILRKVAWVDTAGAEFNLSGSAIGWGVNTSSNIKFMKKDTGRLSVVYGKAIENYMNDAPVDIGVKNNPANPLSPIKGIPLPVLGVVSFLDHNWSDKFSTAVGYSMVNIDGAVLANNGKNPATGEQVIKREDIPYILSAMTMAGLYDSSGSWAWHVGLPAKSGVGRGDCCDRFWQGSHRRICAAAR